MLKAVLASLALIPVLTTVTPSLARPVQQSATGACVFCEPRFVRTEPVFAPAPHGYGTVAMYDTASRYTRFDVEGIRLLQRMH